jgi:hypothetical protein
VWSSCPEQPVGDLGAAQEADATRAPSPQKALAYGFPASRWTATTCSPSTPPAARRWRARGGDGPDPHRVRDLSPRRAHHRRRSHQVPLGRGGRRGSARIRSRASRLSREAEPARAGPEGGGRGDRRAPPWRFEARGPPDPLDMFDHVYADAPPSSRPSAPSWRRGCGDGRAAADGARAARPAHARPATTQARRWAHDS